MRNRRFFLALAIPVFLTASLVAALVIRAPRVSAALVDLMGEAGQKIPRFLREDAATQVSIIASSCDAEKAARVAARLGTSPAASSVSPDALAFIRAARGGLVSREMARLLETPAGRATIAKRAMRRLFSSPVPPVLGVADDPFFLTDSFLLSLGARPADVKTRPDGLLSRTTNGVTSVLSTRRLEKDVAENLDKTIAFCEDLRRERERAEEEGVEVVFAGAAVHTAESAARSRTEINVLTFFSLTFIALLALVVFRSWRWIPLLLLSLAVAALSGALALVLLFRDLHVMTFVMGTTVLGLVIDYSFHFLLAPATDKPIKSLVISFLTTEMSLVPLMLSAVPLLAQSAIFLGVGLFAALAYVLSTYPRTAVQTPCVSLPTLSSRTTKSVRILLAILFVACMAGILKTSVRTEMTALYRPSVTLAAAERLRASFGSFDVTRVPSDAARRATSANVKRLYDEQGPALAKALSLPALALPPEPTATPLRPQELLAQIFGDWTAAALKSLVFAILALFLALLVLCRARAVRLFLPSLIACLSVAGLLGWRGESVNLFHLLAFFLLLGMGVDYAVFLQSGERTSWRSAWSALLTSLAGFGALAFVSFPVVASFGFVLGVGLPIAFAAAWLFAPPPSNARHESVEKGASPLGLEILFLFYRIAGLRVLHILSALTGASLWLFSPSIRRASPSLRKVVLFTRSLADKLVVMANGKDLPKVEIDPASPDAAAFLDDVQRGAGVFVLSSHVGTIEVLTALGACSRVFHAWMDVARTSVFNRFYLRHAARARVVIHPISSFHMGTVFEAGDVLDAGDCLVMAGDRGDGAFRFAAALGHRVYFVACILEKGGLYRAIVRRLPDTHAAMKVAYDEIVATLVREHPEQAYTWA